MAAALVLCGSKRRSSTFFDEFSSSLHLPQSVRAVKKAKLSNENPSDDISKEWADLLVQEITSATSTDDAKARAARAIEVFEQLIRSSAAAAEAEVAAGGKEKEEENVVLKQEIERIEKENSILRRAVCIQEECFKVLGGQNQELEHMKQLVKQHEQQISNLEFTNYKLRLHLQQSQQCNNSIPLSFHPHLF